MFVYLYAKLHVENIGVCVCVCDTHTAAHICVMYVCITLGVGEI